MSSKAVVIVPAATDPPRQKKRGVAGWLLAAHLREIPGFGASGRGPPRQPATVSEPPPLAAFWRTNVYCFGSGIAGRAFFGSRQQLTTGAFSHSCRCSWLAASPAHQMH